MLFLSLLWEPRGIQFRAGPTLVKSLEPPNENRDTENKRRDCSKVIFFLGRKLHKCDRELHNERRVNPQSETRYSSKKPSALRCPFVVFLVLYTVDTKQQQQLCKLGKNWIPFCVFPAPWLKLSKKKSNRGKKKTQHHHPANFLHRDFWGCLTKGCWMNTLGFEKKRIQSGERKYLHPNSYGDSTTWWKMRRGTDGFNGSLQISLAVETQSAAEKLCFLPFKSINQPSVPTPVLYTSNIREEEFLLT